MSGNDVMFPVISMESSKLCGGNLNFPIKVSNFSSNKKLIFFKIELYNYKDNGNHKWKGEFIIPASKLGKIGEVYNLYNTQKKKSAGKKIVKIMF